MTRKPHGPRESHAVACVLVGLELRVEGAQVLVKAVRFMTVSHPASFHLLPCKHLLLYTAQQSNTYDQKPPVTFNRSTVGSKVFSLAHKQSRIRRGSYHHGLLASSKPVPTCATNHDSASVVRKPSKHLLYITMYVTWDILIETSLADRMSHTKV